MHAHRDTILLHTPIHMESLLNNAALLGPSVHSVRKHTHTLPLSERWKRLSTQPPTQREGQVDCLGDSLTFYVFDL